MKHRAMALVLATTAAAILLTGSGLSFAQTSGPPSAGSDQGQAGSGSGQGGVHHGHHHHHQSQPQGQ
jgi:hypothetical protein